MQSHAPLSRIRTRPPQSFSESGRSSSSFPSNSADGPIISASPTHASGSNYRARLPKVRCSRRTQESPRSLSSGQTSPRTPRRRHGRVAAGAASTLLKCGQALNSHVAPFSLAVSLFGQGWGASNGSCHRGGSVAAYQGEKDVREPIIERSQVANEDLLLFFFQLDLGTRLQRALNQDQYEAAQQLREKITEVDGELQRRREARQGSSSAKEEAQDKSISLLQLKSRLQSAIEAEKYTEAAEVRDQISKMESEALAASALALASRGSLSYAFRLGQKVKHVDFGYRGVIAGMDPVCCESEGWVSQADIEGRCTDKGSAQPFYTVLLDMNSDPGFLVAYVPEEKLRAPEEPDKESFEHPYIYLLFYGVDSNGDFIPCRQLREKHDAARHEVPYEEEENGEGETDSDGGDATKGDRQ